MIESDNASRNGWRPSGRCAIFVCDIVSFGRDGRHDGVQGHLRTAMYEALRRSFDESGVPFDRCYWEDRGDGVIVVPPPDIETTVLVHPLIDRLRGALRRHNELSSDLAKIRLRVSLHVGNVEADGRGIVGTAVNHANRLLDAPTFKEAILLAEAHIGLIVSVELYEAVVRPGTGLIDPDEYEVVEVVVKETRTTAWMRISAPGRGVARAPARGLRRSEPDPPARERPMRAMDATAHQGSMTELFEVVKMLLAVPIMTTPEGREQVIGSLHPDVAVRIPRRSQANLDTHSILRTCLDFPGAVGELLAVLKAFAGDSEQMRALEETIDRLGRRR
ncbi:effector-associated domain 2-containing protein [Actinomadura sp. HBU206391]|uniref:effector-associated domain 2-containing protein n=1 Tax=Actinomadura sp. HBU206391 TaxID=2731692 RepID=UPI00164F25FE|nr:hypothetical protein [Actinomadura sp. HBU206391]MBC6459878.1 hypothetical protein [Actinomadura sp. HBU206391]